MHTPPSHRRTALLLVAFVLVAAATIKTTSNTLFPSHRMARNPTSVHVLGEKISHPGTYLKIDGVNGHATDPGHQGEFTLIDSAWISSGADTSYLQAVVETDENSNTFLTTLTAGSPIKQMVLSSARSDGTTVSWKLTSVTILSVKLSAKSSTAPFTTELLLSAKKVTRLADDANNPADCAALSDQPTCEQHLSCFWTDPPKNAGVKNVIQIKGICAPVLPPPVPPTDTSTLPVDPTVTHSDIPLDTTAATKKVPTETKTDVTTANTATAQSTHSDTATNSSAATSQNAASSYGTAASGYSSSPSGVTATQSSGTTDSSGGTSASSGNVSGGSTTF